MHQKSNDCKKLLKNYVLFENKAYFKKTASYFAYANFII